MPRVAASRATSLWAVGPNSDAPKANMFAKPKAFLRKALARPRAVARRCLQSAPVTAVGIRDTKAHIRGARASFVNVFLLLSFDGPRCPPAGVRSHSLERNPGYGKN